MVGNRSDGGNVFERRRVGEKHLRRKNRQKYRTASRPPLYEETTWETTEGTQIQDAVFARGPMINAKQFAKVIGFLYDATAFEFIKIKYSKNIKQNTRKK